MTDTRYSGSSKRIGPLIVKFKVKATGKVLERGFYNMRSVDIFLYRLKHSKRCELISCPADAGK